jgi:hypothetical protein
MPKHLFRSNMFWIGRRIDGNTDNERMVKTRGNLKSDGCSGGYIKSWLDHRIKQVGAYTL